MGSRRSRRATASRRYRHRRWTCWGVAAVVLAEIVTAITVAPPPAQGAVSPSAGPVPPARTDAAMAYDPAMHEVLMFGGYGRSFTDLGDTWAWNGHRWTQLHPKTSPSARQGAEMAYDPADREMVLFGGSTSGGDATGTWLWRDGDWHRARPTTSPPEGVEGGVVYDGTIGAVVQYGGFGNDQWDSATPSQFWIWDGRNWAVDPQQEGPGRRADFAMTYAASTGMVLLFGGWTAYGGHSSTDSPGWDFDGASWAPLPTTGGPGPLYAPAAAYDVDAGSVVLFGGTGRSDMTSGATWTWVSGVWTQERATGPSARFGSQMAYDPATGQVMLFGGRRRHTLFLSDTWTWNGSHWYLVARGHRPLR